MINCNKNCPNREIFTSLPVVNDDELWRCVKCYLKQLKKAEGLLSYCSTYIDCVPDEVAKHYLKDKIKERLND